MNDNGSTTIGQRHVMVVGMHRSGTSAVANGLFELGVGLPVDTEMIGTGPYNEKGHWESRDLARLDEAVLRYLGGTWSAPPLPDPGWETSDEPVFASLRAQAMDLASRSFARPPIVLKDPRFCITLPLWRAILGRPPCAVLVVRDPFDVARSLQRRDGFPLTLGLAIWERYVRQSILSVAGLPVYAVEYGSIVDDPRGRISELAEFLSSCEVNLPKNRTDQAVSVFEKDLRHHNREGIGVTPEPHSEMFDLLRSCSGAHASFTPPELPQEPAWVGDVLWLTAAGQAVTAGLQAAQWELKWIKRSRLFRTSRAFWRATGTGPVLSPSPDESTDDSPTDRANDVARPNATSPRAGTR
jgi:hypothetical protein